MSSPESPFFEYAKGSTTCTMYMQYHVHVVFSVYLNFCCRSHMDMVKTCVWSLERAESSVCVPVSPVLLSIRFHCGRRERWREGEMEGG